MVSSNGFTVKMKTKKTGTRMMKRRRTRAPSSFLLKNNINISIIV
jgi:hypothetical protein